MHYARVCAPRFFADSMRSIISNPKAGLMEKRKAEKRKPIRTCGKIEANK